MDGDVEDIIGPGRIDEGIDNLEQRNFAEEKNYQVYFKEGELYIQNIVSKQKLISRYLLQNKPTAEQIIKVQIIINGFIEKEKKERKITVSNVVPFLDIFPIQIPRLENNYYISTIPEHKGYIPLVDRLISEYIQKK